MIHENKENIPNSDASTGKSILEWKKLYTTIPNIIIENIPVVILCRGKNISPKLAIICNIPTNILPQLPKPTAW